MRQARKSSSPRTGGWGEVEEGIRGGPLAQRDTAGPVDRVPVERLP
jgi:hypothetical protein